MSNENDWKLRDWRTDRFLAMGFHPKDADALAESSIDWREVERLLAKGCPAQLAIYIAY